MNRAQLSAIIKGYGLLSCEEGVDLMPSSIELSGIENQMMSVMSREFVLKTYVDQRRPHYDYILIDCTPSLNMLPVNAFVAADSIIVPSQPRILSTKGLDLLMNSYRKVQKAINPDLRIDGILFTMADFRTNNDNYMNTSGEAADQVLRMTLEGTEAALKITGKGAGKITVLLYKMLSERFAVDANGFDFRNSTEFFAGKTPKEIRASLEKMRVYANELSQPMMRMLEKTEKSRSDEVR